MSKNAKLLYIITLSLTTCNLRVRKMFAPQLLALYSWREFLARDNGHVLAGVLLTMNKDTL